MSPPGVTINRLADSVSVPGPDIPGFTMSLFVVPGTHLQEWDVTTKWKGVGCQGDGCPPSGCQVMEPHLVRDLLLRASQGG